MTVSQLLRVMDPDELVFIDDYDAPIDHNRLYQGYVGDIREDDPMKDMVVESICAGDEVLLLLVTNSNITKETVNNDS